MGVEVVVKTEPTGDWPSYTTVHAVGFEEITAA
jgi:hypothetical protein